LVSNVNRKTEANCVQELGNEEKYGPQRLERDMMPCKQVKGSVFQRSRLPSSSTLRMSKKNARTGPEEEIHWYSVTGSWLAGSVDRSIREDQWTNQGDVHTIW
jgi:hypothetical protein